MASTAVVYIQSENQEDLDYQLRDAAENGNIVKVKKALEKGAIINCTDSYQWTPLHKAARKGHSDVVKVLLKYGANPSITNSFLETPLQIASEKGHAQVVQILRSVINHNDYELQYFSEIGNIEKVRAAIKNGANVNGRDEYKRAALHKAVHNGHNQVVQVLLLAGADPSIINKDKETPLYLAAKKGYVEVVQLLLNYNANANIADKEQMTPMAAAAKRGHTEVVCLLLQAGGNPNSKNKYMEAPLYLAAEGGHTDIVQLLLSHGVNPNVADRDSSTPLHIASNNGHLPVVELLCQYNADMYAVNKRKDRPLDMARTRCKGHVVRFLSDQIMDQECRYILTSGLKKGCVYITNLKLVIMGPPCVGKTAFKYLLFNWPAPEVHNSTALATRPIRAIERVAERDNGKIWVNVTGADLMKMLSDAIQEHDSESLQSPSTGSTRHYSFRSSSISSVDLRFRSASESQSAQCQNSISVAIGQDVFSPTAPFPLQPESLPNRDNSNSPSSSVSDVFNLSDDNPLHSKLEPDMDFYPKEMVDTLARRLSFKSEELHKATWIHLLDSGGQPQFADISRAFLRHNMLNIIVTKLTENLSDKPHFCYSLQGKVLNQPNQLQMTNLQLIEHFVRSIAASKNANGLQENESEAPKPYFLLVGTCNDKRNGLKGLAYESLKKKNMQLLNVLQDYRDHLIFYNEATEELIFPVNNLCVRNRQKISALAREKVMSKKNISRPVPIPVRWYMFEICLTEEASHSEHGVISLESCYTIGLKLGMDSNDVLKCVNYLDSLTLLLYFSKVLPNIIFTNPQYLLDMLSALIQISFVDVLEDVLPAGQTLCSQTQQLLRENGVFEESLLDKISLSFVPLLFTKPEFLKLLQYLRIVAPLFTTDKVKRYFLPIVLPPSQLSIKDKPFFLKSCDPMVITFKNKVVPQGVFPAVVVALLSRKETPLFSLDSRSPTFPRQLRYAVKLYSEDLLGSILLVDTFNWIEVYYTGLTENCPVILEIIKAAVSSCAKILAYDNLALNCMVTVPCELKHRFKETSRKMHPVTISFKKTPPIIGCSIETELPLVPLTNCRQSCWFTNSTSVSVSTDHNSSQHQEFLRNTSAASVQSDTSFTGGNLTHPFKLQGDRPLFGYRALSEGSSTLDVPSIVNSTETASPPHRILTSNISLPVSSTLSNLPGSDPVDMSPESPISDLATTIAVNPSLDINTTENSTSTLVGEESATATSTGYFTDAATINRYELNSATTPSDNVNSHDGPLEPPADTVSQFPDTRRRSSTIISVSSFIPDGPLNECHLSALIKFVKDVHDWEILGIHLGVKDVVIKDIKAANHYQPQPARKDMLVEWLRGGNAKRSDLFEALKSINENRLIQDIIESAACMET